MDEHAIIRVLFCRGVANERGAHIETSGSNISTEQACV